MFLRARRALIIAAAALTAALPSIVAPSITGHAPRVAAAGDPNEVIAFVVEGTGNGHGRGLSQWGAFGRALAGQTWQQIIDTYYQG
ncbi:MAG TPA: hypothetical protein VGK49_13595, partial [Ilumatobacteraceae bacterium]